MVMTSPPYYDLEVYDQEDSKRHEQSITRYDTVEEWYQGFLLPTMKKAVNSLAKYGSLILSLNDKPDKEEPYTERLVRDLSAMVTLQYEGVLHVTTDLSYEHAVKDGTRVEGCQPLWVWRKTCEVDL